MLDEVAAPDTTAIDPRLAGVARAVDRGVTRLFIDGGYIAASTGDAFDTVNPADGRRLARVGLGGHDDVDRAVLAARQALSGEWATFGPARRQQAIDDLADLIDEHADEIALIDSLEMGAPLVGARRRMRDTVARLRWYAAQSRTISGRTIENSTPQDLMTYTVKEPVGVVGAITPWNGPLSAAVMKVAPVLATGCTVVHKPAEESPLSALLLAEFCREVGIPPGVVNVVTGDGHTGAMIAEHPDVDKVSFTGSVETGQKIVHASAGTLKRLTLELGGKSPTIVCGDADLEAAVPGAALSVFMNSGQACIAGSRLFVDERIFDEFVARLVDFTATLAVGDPLEPTTDLGPLVSSNQLDRVLDLIASGQDQGAVLRSGGGRLTDGNLAGGYFVPPTVFTEVRDDMRIMQEEIFGPVVAAAPFRSLDEIVERANGTEFGLGAYVWANDVKTVHRLVRGIRSGSVWVNTGYRFDNAVPFGGHKKSGYGRDAGLEQIEAHLETKSVWIGLT